MTTKAEAQRLFERVVSAVVRQGEPSVNKHRQCLYRGPRGLKCAAGHIIRDSEYSRSMEKLPIEDLGSLLPDRLRPHIDLISKLQSAHDDNDRQQDFVGSFVRDCKSIAVDCRLKLPRVALRFLPLPQAQ